MITVAQIAAPARFGGLESLISALSAGLYDEGHLVVLVLILDVGVQIPEWAGELKAKGVNVETLFIPPRAYRLERRLVMDTLRRHKVEVVHTHGSRVDVVDGRAAVNAGYPVVSTAHGFVRLGIRSHIYSWLQIRALRRFDAIVAVSDALSIELRNRGVASDKLVTVPNSIAPSSKTQKHTRESARSVLSLPQEGTVIGWVGRLSAEKAPDLALRALERMKLGQATLCVIGDGPMMRELRALALSLGIDERVTFVGAVESAASLFPAFDLLTLSSHTEGTPMTLLEAGAAGVPIVATSVGGVPALLGDDGGWLVPCCDALALAEAVETALNNPSERALRAGAMARRVEAGYDRWLAAHVALYQRVRGRKSTTHLS